MALAGRRDAPEPPDFGILKRLARDQLVYLLEQLPGKKDLFIEADLMSPLDRIANVSILKQHDVDKLYKVESRPGPGASDQFCFLVRPRVRSMRLIADIVNADKMSGRSRKYKIIFSPQKFYACEMVLEEEGVIGDVTCDEWSFYLLPLDEDIISMELPEFFRDYFLEGDHRWINPVARALQLLSSLYGPFGRAYGIGRCAKMSYELWRDLEEESDSEGQGRRPEIGHVFLMDRDTDYVTALCSQVVYEGLVDDTFRIKCGSVDFGPDVTSSDKSIKVLLNSQDKVFNQHGACSGPCSCGEGKAWGGTRSVSVRTDSNLCRFFLTCGSPNWWGSCVPAPSPVADGAGISESAGEQGQLCQCFDTVGGELKAELPDKCSDQKKFLYLTRIHVFHVELNSWHIPQALGDHKGFGV